MDLDALLCALVLAPQTFSRNRFFWLYQQPGGASVRRRAARVRGVVRQLLGRGRSKATLIGEQVLDDGQVLLRYRIQDLSYSRTVALSDIEAAVLRFALHRVGAGALSKRDRAMVEGALSRLGHRLEAVSP
ncbi:MAG TPA: hypothetical protein VGJ84_09600 [Polyangiaceae bacterium]